MANTGKEIVLTIKEVTLPYPPGVPTGNTKPNSPSDPDYIAPYINTTNCPVTADLTCPMFVATGGAGTVQFEFSLLDSVTANTSIASIRIQLMDSTNTTVQQVKDYTLPMTPSTNYKVDSFTSVVAGTHVLNALYLDNTSATLATCTNVATVTTT